MIPFWYNSNTHSLTDRNKIFKCDETWNKQMICQLEIKFSFSFASAPRAGTHTHMSFVTWQTKTKRNETRYKLQKRVRIKMEMQFHSKGWNDKIRWYLLSVGWAYMEKSYFILLSFHFPFYLYRVSIYRIVSGYVDDSVQFKLVVLFSSSLFSRLCFSYVNLNK